MAATPPTGPSPGNKFRCRVMYTREGQQALLKEFSPLRKAGDRTITGRRRQQQAVGLEDSGDDSESLFDSALSPCHGSRDSSLPPSSAPPGLQLTLSQPGSMATLPILTPSSASRPSPLPWPSVSGPSPSTGRSSAGTTTATTPGGSRPPRAASFGRSGGKMLPGSMVLPGQVLQEEGVRQEGSGITEGEPHTLSARETLDSMWPSDRKEAGSFSPQVTPRIPTLWRGQPPGRPAPDSPSSSPRRDISSAPSSARSTSSPRRGGGGSSSRPASSALALYRTPEAVSPHGIRLPAPPVVREEADREQLQEESTPRSSATFRALMQSPRSPPRSPRSIMDIPAGDTPAKAKRIVRDFQQHLQRGTIQTSRSLGLSSASSFSILGDSAVSVQGSHLQQYTVLVDSVRRALDFITETMSAADDEEGLALSTLERLDQELTEAHTGLTAKLTAMQEKRKWRLIEEMGLPPGSENDPVPDLTQSLMPPPEQQATNTPRKRRVVNSNGIVMFIEKEKSSLMSEIMEDLGGDSRYAARSILNQILIGASYEIDRLEERRFYEDRRAAEEREHSLRERAQMAHEDFDAHRIRAMERRFLEQEKDWKTIQQERDSERERQAVQHDVGTLLWGCCNAAILHSQEANVAFCRSLVDSVVDQAVYGSEEVAELYAASIVEGCIGAAMFLVDNPEDSVNYHTLRWKVKSQAYSHASQQSFVGVGRGLRLPRVERGVQCCEQDFLELMTPPPSSEVVRQDNLLEEKLRSLPFYRRFQLSRELPDSPFMITRSPTTAVDQSPQAARLLLNNLHYGEEVEGSEAGGDADAKKGKKSKTLVTFVHTSVAPPALEPPAEGRSLPQRRSQRYRSKNPIKSLNAFSPAGEDLPESMRPERLEQPTRRQRRVIVDGMPVWEDIPEDEASEPDEDDSYGKFFVLDWRNTISCVVDTYMGELLDDVVEKVEVWGDALLRKKESIFETSQYGKGASTSRVRGMLRAANRAFMR